MKKSIIYLLVFFSPFAYGQNLNIPAYSEGAPNNYFTAGNGDGGSLDVYNVFLKLHNGLAIGSAYVNTGQGGYSERATLAIDGRTGSLTTIGNIKGAAARFAENVGVGTDNPTAWFPGKVVEIKDNRPILRLSPISEGGLATVLSKGLTILKQVQKMKFTLIMSAVYQTHGW